MCVCVCVCACVRVRACVPVYVCVCDLITVRKFNVHGKLSELLFIKILFCIFLLHSMKVQYLNTQSHCVGYRVGW